MKRKDLARRAASAAMAACMMFTLSAPALAASTDALLQQSTAAKSAVSVLDEENGTEIETAYQMNLKYGSITVYIGADGKQYAKQGDNDAQQRGNLWITTDGSPTDNTITIEGGTVGAKVTLSNVKIETTSNAAVSVSGNVELVIAGTNTLRSGENHAGVEKADDNGTLTISGTGTLEAHGGEHGAGIGGVWDRGASNIVIEGGTIEAHGGRWGAGIGGGHSAAGQNITIRDGNVTAKPGGEAAGIGGGYRGDGKNITIEGGTVYAESGGGNGRTAAIGGGRETGKGENIQITGGNVTVKSVTGVWIGGKDGEITIDTSKLLGTITKLDKDDNPVAEIVQDFGIEVSEQPVTSENYKNLWKGYIVYDPEYKTLTAKDRIPQGVVKIRAPKTDVFLNGGMQRGTLTIGQVGDKIVVGAHDVTVKHDQYAAIYGDVNINCTGKVDIRSDEDMAVNGSLNIYDSSEVTLSAGSSVVKDSANITSKGDVTIESTDGRAAKNLTINNAKNVTVIINDDTRAISENTKITASGTVTLKNTAEGGRVGAVAFKQADGKDYVYYTSEGADKGAIDASVTPIPSDVPYCYLRIEEKQNARIKVNNGTVTVGDTTKAQLDSFKGQKVKVTATGTESDDRKFDGWEVVAPAGFTIDADKLREESFEFIMPAGEVELTAHYASKLSVTGGTAKVNGEPVDFARKGAAVTVTAADRGEDYKFDHWELSEDSAKIGLNNEELKNATLNFSMPDGPVKLTAVYSAAVTVVNGIAKAGTKSGETIFALKGETVTVSGKNRNLDVATFGGWKVISPEDFELTEAQKNTEENMTFTMPASPVELKASYSFPAPVLDMQVTVNGGTIRVGEGERQTGTVFVQPGQTVTIEADEPAKENESFHHWKVEEDSSKNIGIIEGSLGSETEKGTEKIVFTMPQDGVKLTAVYSIPASVLKSTVTVTGGTAKSTLDEGKKIYAKVGETVEITATPYDAEENPGMEFVEWEIKYPDSFYKKFPDGIPEELQLKLDNAKSAATTFEMPAYPVELIAHWSASAVAGPDEPLDPDFGYDDGSAAGGAIAAVAVGGAAIWGGYEIATRVILHDLLPEGAAIPANRGQLALLVWNTAGRPEPAGTPAFADVADPDMAKAAQWCTEQGIMDAKGDRFEPEGWTPKFKVIEVWNKAFPKQ